MTPVTAPAFEFWPAVGQGNAAQNRIASNAAGSRGAVILSELVSIETRLKRAHTYFNSWAVSCLDFQDDFNGYGHAKREACHAQYHTH